MNIIDEIVAERKRQVNTEGWTTEYDDEHVLRELARAAAAYAYPHLQDQNGVPHIWPWSSGWWKPSTTRRGLIKAAALILAEIERLDRYENRPVIDGEEGVSVRDHLSFNLYLRKLRQDRGWSLRDAEKITNGRISNAYLSQLENGKIEAPSVAMIHTLSALYGVDFEDLCYRALTENEPLPPVPCCPTCGRPYA